MHKCLYEIAFKFTFFGKILPKIIHNFVRRKRQITSLTLKSPVKKYTIDERRYNLHRKKVTGFHFAAEMESKNKTRN